MPLVVVLLDPLTPTSLHAPRISSIMARPRGRLCIMAKLSKIDTTTGHADALEFAG